MSLRLAPTRKPPSRKHAEGVVVFRGDDTLLGGVVPEDDVAHLLLSRHFLQLDEHRHGGKGAEDFVEGGNVGAGAELLEASAR